MQTLPDRLHSWWTNKEALIAFALGSKRTIDRLRTKIGRADKAADGCYYYLMFGASTTGRAFKRSAMEATIMLQTLLGIAWMVIGGLLFAGQFISVINFPLAQRLGLQEDPVTADPMSSHLELMTARWDIVLLWLPPVAGLLMLLNHPWWPAMGLIAGGIYVDTGGREWVKIVGLDAQGVPVGSAKEQIVMKATYGFFVITGLAAIALALVVMV